MKQIAIPYIRVEGTVGDTKVDLTLSIPVESVVAALPSVMDMILKHLPTFMKAADKFKVALEKAA